MSVFLHGGRHTSLQAARLYRPWLTSRYASRISIPTPPPFPVVETCPAPSCECAEMPSDLEINHELPLNGTMASYAEQVLISTGQPDWKSKIEEEEDSAFLKQMKKFVGRGGKYSDPYHNVALTNSSFHAAGEATIQTTASESSASDTNNSSTPRASAYLLPSFKYIPSIPVDDKSVSDFLRGFVLPNHLHPSHDVLSQEQKDNLLRQPSLQSLFPTSRDVDEILVLICGHGGRDRRCGVMGPLLAKEFESKLLIRGVELLQDTPPLNKAQEREAKAEATAAAVAAAAAATYTPAGATPTPGAKVGLISHIGGHKFAGNVIIYIPPSFAGNALAGKGIWYGRVEPRHVEGIVDATILGGRVIKELLRGGVGQGGEILRL